MTDERATDRVAPEANDIQSFTVRVVLGPDEHGVCSSNGTELTIGTDPACDLILSDPAVSRHHCALEMADSGIVLRDLDSTNGTLISGHRISKATLTSGAVIGVGRSLVELRVTNDRIARPLSPRYRFGRLIGVSPAMRHLFALLERIAPSEATALVEGETGTGKTAIAEAIHEASPRKWGPFVVVDCGAIPTRLIESELFGHERGAFTGARSARTGLIEAAHRGTLFLDEIGELPMELQPRLLRVLERGQIKRVGTNVVTPVDVRVLAASNRDLRRAVNKGTLRPDLWYRINTVRLVVPPLRERREDIPLLATAFHREATKDPEAIPPSDFVARLQRGEWPGNVRELRSAIERSVLLSDPAPWTTEEEREVDLPFRIAKLRATERWERDYLERLIHRHRGNISAASRAARMNRNYLRERLHHHGIEIR